MATWSAARIEDVQEIDDGRVPWRAVRAHFDISAFGVNVFIAAAAGDRLVNEHDEADDGQEELYLVHTGHARFELDGETVDAPAGTLVYLAGEHTELAARLDAALADDPPYSAVHFNAACVYSLAGRKEDALAHLGRALELSENVRELARTDSDLDGIRDEPRFRELVG